MDILDKIYIRIFEDDIKAINKELGNMPAFFLQEQRIDLENKIRMDKLEIKRLKGGVTNDG